MLYHESEIPPHLLEFFEEVSVAERPTQPCVVCDPFGGSGTTGEVALELGRNAVLIELNPKYADLARRRTAVTPGLQLA